MSATEIRVTLEWLDVALASVGATGGVYRNVAPAGAVGPYIVVTLYGPSDVMGVAGKRLWVNNTWLIEVWGTDDQFATLESVASALDAALQQQRNIGTPSGQILSCVREQARFGPPEEVGNQQWTRIGGVYRIQAKAS